MSLDTQVRKSFRTSTQKVWRFVLEGLSGIQNFQPSLSKVFFLGLLTRDVCLLGSLILIVAFLKMQISSVNTITWCCKTHSWSFMQMQTSHGFTLEVQNCFRVHTMITLLISWTLDYILTNFLNPYSSSSSHLAGAYPGFLVGQSSTLGVDGGANMPNSPKKTKKNCMKLRNFLGGRGDAGALPLLDPPMIQFLGWVPITWASYFAVTFCFNCLDLWLKLYTY